MVLVLSNKLTEMFVNQELSRGSVSYKQVNMENIMEIESIKNSIMYYDKVFVGVNLKYDYRDIISLIQMETNEINIILLVQTREDYSKIKGVMARKDVECTCVTTATLSETKVSSLIRQYFEENYGKEFNEKDIKSIYRFLRFKTNINKELTEIGNFRTLTKMREYVNKREGITSNNFWYYLLMKERDKEVAMFLLDNSYRLNYIIAILSNKLDKVMKVYEKLMENEHTSKMKMYSEDEKMVREMTSYEFMQHCKLIDKLSYEEMYSIKDKLTKSKTKVEKQIVIVGLI